MATHVKSYPDVLNFIHMQLGRRLLDQYHTIDPLPPTSSQFHSRETQQTFLAAHELEHKGVRLIVFQSVSPLGSGLLMCSRASTCEGERTLAGRVSLEAT